MPSHLEISVLQILSKAVFMNSILIENIRILRDISFYKETWMYSHFSVEIIIGAPKMMDKLQAVY